MRPQHLRITQMWLLLSICRSIASRRFFFLIGTLYLYRCVTMYITTLPVPGMHMTCAPKVSSAQTSERASAVVAQPCTPRAPSGTHFAQPRKRGSYKKAILTFYCLRTPTILRCISVWSKTCAPGSCLLGCVELKDQRSDSLGVVLFPRFWNVLDRVWKPLATCKKWVILSNLSTKHKSTRFDHV